MTQFTVYPDDEAAAARGYAPFNPNPHLAVDIPDGRFTITARTSEGKRITFAFLPYQEGGPPQCVDIQYHDKGTFRTSRDHRIPTFDMVVFNGPYGSAYDSRTLHPRGDDKPSIACILLEPLK